MEYTLMLEDFRLAIQSFDNPDQGWYIGLCMVIVTGVENDLTTWLIYCNSALSFRNINTNCIHENYSFEMY